MITKDFVKWLKNENKILNKLNWYRDLLKRIRKKLKEDNVSEKLRKELEGEIKYVKSEIEEIIETAYLYYFEI